MKTYTFLCNQIKTKKNTSQFIKGNLSQTLTIKVKESKSLETLCLKVKVFVQPVKDLGLVPIFESEFSLQENALIISPCFQALCSVMFKIFYFALNA